MSEKPSKRPVGCSIGKICVMDKPIVYFRGRPCVPLILPNICIADELTVIRKLRPAEYSVCDSSYTLMADLFVCLARY